MSTPYLAIAAAIGRPCMIDTDKGAIAATIMDARESYGTTHLLVRYSCLLCRPSSTNQFTGWTMGTRDRWTAAHLVAVDIDGIYYPALSQAVTADGPYLSDEMRARLAAKGGK